MKIHTFIFALALIGSGCDSKDSKLRQQVAGTWQVPPSGSMTFQIDGSYHFTNALVSSNATMSWSGDGTWDVRDGFLITTVTNSLATNADEKPSVGVASRSKINLVDEHNLAYGDEKHGASYHR